MGGYLPPRWACTHGCRCITRKSCPVRYSGGEHATRARPAGGLNTTKTSSTDDRAASALLCFAFGRAASKPQCSEWNYRSLRRRPAISGRSFPTGSRRYSKFSSRRSHALVCIPMFPKNDQQIGRQRVEERNSPCERAFCREYRVKCCD